MYSRLHVLVSFRNDEIKENEIRKDTEQFKNLVDRINEKQIQINGAARPLEPGHTYDFRVRAHSIAATSDPSNTVTYTIPGKYF